jgi:hypothetical protein
VVVVRLGPGHSGPSNASRPGLASRGSATGRSRATQNQKPQRPGDAVLVEQVGFESAQQNAAPHPPVGDRLADQALPRAQRRSGSQQRVDPRLPPVVTRDAAEVPRVRRFYSLVR